VAAPVGRLAPSPTGALHLGHARSFLLGWWHARSRGGRVLLRIEDLDGERCRPELIERMLADLAWLGLDWDGEPSLQSRGIDALNAAVGELCERGLVYPCVCTRADVRAAQSAPQAGDEELRYPGTCAGRWASAADAERESGRAACLRLRVAPGAIEVRDAFAGVHRFDPAREVGDFPVTRRSGLPAYQLAAVVDDARSGVTEIVRGDDLLPSTARQILLQRALRLPQPAWWHVPLVLDAGGRRLAKRHGAPSLAELRARGVDARAVVGWVARVSGIEADARPAARDLLGAFSMARVPRAPVRLAASDLAALCEARP
jgi:glutamyl-tRNA synthetase